jgi:hypothetical protein
MIALKSAVKNSLSPWERAGVRGEASTKRNKEILIAIDCYPSDPNPLPRGEGSFSATP